MIKTRTDLQYFLKEDLKRYPKKPKWWKKFGGSEVYDIYAFFKNLRYLEYYQNNRFGFINNLFYYWFLLQHNNRRLQTHIYVSPNVFGPGVHFVHPGFLRADNFVRVGKNCTILPNVLFGKKNHGSENCGIIIGDNAYISTNTTILGPVKIGDNVTIAAGAVVNKDIPDNAVVAGVPAKIIKFNE